MSNYDSSYFGNVFLKQDNKYIAITPDNHVFNITADDFNRISEREAVFKQMDRDMVKVPDECIRYQGSEYRRYLNGKVYQISYLSENAKSISVITTEYYKAIRDLYEQDLSI